MRKRKYFKLIVSASSLRLEKEEQMKPKEGKWYRWELKDQWPKTGK
jgi:hypothetical protein